MQDELDGGGGGVRTSGAQGLDHVIKHLAY